MATTGKIESSSSKTIKSSHYYCCVPMCNSDGRYDVGVSFHHIPKDENKRKTWIIKIKRDEGSMFKISSNTVVCSKHFTKDDYTGWGPVRKRLKGDAVPSVFDWTGDKTPRRTIKRKILDTPESSNSKRQREGELVQEPEIEVDTEMYTAIPLQTHYERKIEELRAKLNQKTDECCVKESLGACPTGYWGADCKLKCAAGCYLNQACNENNGVCTRCIDGFYGPHCVSQCAENCRRCEQDTGVCTYCEITWYGPFCKERCSNNCYSCSNNTNCNICLGGYWGTFCENECLPIAGCEQNCSTSFNTSTCEYTCKCTECGKDDGSCYNKICEHGFWGSDCERACPINCLSSCNMYNGECTIDCRYTLYDYSYICEKCLYGYWGSKCQYPCTLERCLQCNPYYGYCTQCEQGFWGKHCDHQCSECNECDIESGVCTSCPAGVWGRTCDRVCAGCYVCNTDHGYCIVCTEGSWGRQCENKCSECDVCDKKQGFCTRCPDGSWGRQCEKTCTKCATCNIHDGICETCRLGYWGEECNLTCPEECPCCDIYRGYCRTSGCSINNYGRQGDESDDTTNVTEETSSEGEMSMVTIVGIAMIAVGFILCVVCVTMVVYMFRRLRANQARQSDKENAEEIYDSPVYEDEL